MRRDVIDVDFASIGAGRDVVGLGRFWRRIGDVAKQASSYSIDATDVRDRAVDESRVAFSRLAVFVFRVVVVVGFVCAVRKA